jgi:positive control factor
MLTANRELAERDNWADRMIIEYEHGRRGLSQMKNELDPKDIQDQKDRSVISGMIGEMSEAMEWMKVGHRPGNIGGIEKRSAYQRRSLVNMDLMPSLDIQPKQRELSEEEKHAIRNVLVLLSHRERECYLLHMAQGWSMAEIARELHISKPTVQKYIARAKEKIKEKII